VQGQRFSAATVSASTGLRRGQDRARSWIGMEEQLDPATPETGRPPGARGVLGGAPAQPAAAGSRSGMLSRRSVADLWGTAAPGVISQHQQPGGRLVAIAVVHGESSGHD
jgi:hypothetical protein